MSYYEKTKNELLNLTRKIDEASRTLELNTKNSSDLIERKIAHMKLLKEQLQILVNERQKGFPWLAKAISDLFLLQNNLIAYQLELKKHPAEKAAEEVRKLNKKNAELARENRIKNYLIEYYESIAPFLIELREENFLSDTDMNYQPFTSEESKDEVTQFLTIEEYRKLDSVRRNQIALERYWSRPHSKLEIGRMYERYIGYLYEKDGYEVDYFGLSQGKNDLGRDLICYKSNTIILIQCKNWSQFKQIYENAIFQFFGTFFQLKMNNQAKEVQAHFYTTTHVSDLARSFSKELGIVIHENFKLDKSYPCIRCVDSKDRNTKIYHLPFDQMYDKIKMSKNDKRFYCETVSQAEKKGYRRAYKYHPKK